MYNVASMLYTYSYVAATVYIVWCGTDFKRRGDEHGGLELSASAAAATWLL